MVAAQVGLMPSSQTCVTGEKMQKLLLPDLPGLISIVSLVGANQSR